MNDLINSTITNSDLKMPYSELIRFTNHIIEERITNKVYQTQLVLYFGTYSLPLSTSSMRDRQFKGQKLVYLKLSAQNCNGDNNVQIKYYNYCGIPSKMSLTGSKIGSKYMVGPKIGSGSFGQVYVTNQIGTTKIYALKKEDQKNKHYQLPLQAKVLKQLDGCVGFSKIHWQGFEGKTNIIIIDMLGPTLEDLFDLCDKVFSLKTTAMLADQMLERIEQLHSKNFIHRDIKPENFLMGISGQSHLVHLIDFGLSKRYRDMKTHQHIPYKENKNLTGTARYASINAHLGIQQSRRDDLEAIGYVLVYLVQGFLPWQGIKANTKTEKYQKIMQKKMSIPVERQCDGLPLEFATYLNYCRALKFEDKPDYAFLRRLFRDLIEREKVSYDFQYDWCILKESKQYSNGKIKIDLKANYADDEQFLNDSLQNQSNINVYQKNSQNTQKRGDLTNKKNIPEKNNSQEVDQCNFSDGEENIDEFSSDGDVNIQVGDEIDLEDKKYRMIFD